MSADQNLLFGVLALQADFLDPARFAEACSAWAARKDKPLAELLVERGWLSAEDRHHVEYLLQRKLKKHGGDARASLAEVNNEIVRHSLAGVADFPVLQSLAALSQPNTPVLGFSALGATTAHQPEERGRYTLTRLHASGGIGQVWLARDPELGRDVALKELRPERHDHPAVQARFLEEACITGQLEHPGIVPVHELVRPAEGQPFYTMRMVRGRTLAEAIRDYHRKRQAGNAGPLELRGLLGAIVAVCNAIGYAHSRGVLHRDLKPQNVILGDYGEVIVLDWGLARLFGQHHKPDEATNLLPVSLTAEAGSRDETMQGQVLGTPAYMAPEQAEGRPDLLGPATDVYGLGAILYEILTGLPPFSGGPSDEIIRRVVREAPERPRQRVPGIPPALEAVCLKALAKKPGERYATAGELAKEVERWLADEPVTAWREPWRARAGRWVRRHQTLVAALAAGLLVLLTLGGGGAVWLGREQERHHAAAESALEHVTALQQEARWAEARAKLDQAQARLGEYGSADLRRRLGQARADLELVARLDAIRLERATLKDGRFDDAGAMRKYAEAFAEAGLGEVDEDAAVVSQRVANSAVSEVLVHALDDWASITEDSVRRSWLLGVARRADPNPWRDRLRDPALWQDEQKLVQLVQAAPPADVTPQLVAALGSQLNRRPEGEVLLRAALLRQPGDFWLHLYLGSALDRKNKLEEADASYRTALALRPDSYSIYFSLSWIRQRQGQLVEAEQLLRKALQLQGIDAHHNLGVLLEQQGKLAEAEKEYRKVIAITPDFFLTRENLDGVLQRQGKPGEFEPFLRQTIARDPKSAQAHNSLGIVLERQGNRDEAQIHFRRAHTLAPNVFPFLTNLARVLTQQGKLYEAERLYRRVIELFPDFAEAHSNLAGVLDHQGRWAQSEKQYRKAIDLDPNALGNLWALAGVLQRQSKQVEAQRLLNKANDLQETMYRKVIDSDPKNASAHLNLASALQRQGKFDEAEKQYRETIGLMPKDLLARNNLNIILLQQSRLSEAAVVCRELLELAPGDPASYSNLANVLRRQGKPAEAEKLYRKARDLDPKNRWSHDNLGSVLLQQGKWAEAEASFRKVIDLEPKNSFGHNNLGAVLVQQSKWVEALASFCKAIDLDPNNINACMNLANVLQRQGMLAEALTRYRQALNLAPNNTSIRAKAALAERLIELQPKLPDFFKGEYSPRNNDERLALASLCEVKHLYRACAGLYADAFAADAKLIDNPTAGLRYDAACSAALAGCGKGEDAGKLDDKEKARLRGQARAWLQADLSAWRKKFEKGKLADRAEVQAKMRHWLQDSDFAGVREEEALAALLETERADWAKFWKEVNALRAIASSW